MNRTKWTFVWTINLSSIKLITAKDKFRPILYSIEYHYLELPNVDIYFLQIIFIKFSSFLLWKLFSSWASIRLQICVIQELIEYVSSKLKHVIKIISLIENWKNIAKSLYTNFLFRCTLYTYISHILCNIGNMLDFCVQTIYNKICWYRQKSSLLRFVSN